MHCSIIKANNEPTWYMRSHETEKKKLHRTMEFEYKNKEWRRKKKRAIDDSYLNLLHDHPRDDKSYEMLIGLTIVWKSDGSEIRGIYEISGFISIQVKSLVWQHRLNLLQRSLNTLFFCFLFHRLIFIHLRFFFVTKTFLLCLSFAGEHNI